MWTMFLNIIRRGQRVWRREHAGGIVPRRILITRGNDMSWRKMGRRDEGVCRG